MGQSGRKQAGCFVRKRLRKARFRGRARVPNGSGKLLENSKCAKKNIGQDRLRVANEDIPMPYASKLGVRFPNPFGGCRDAAGSCMHKNQLCVGGRGVDDRGGPFWSQGRMSGGGGVTGRGWRAVAEPRLPSRMSIASAREPCVGWGALMERFAAVHGSR